MKNILPSCDTTYISKDPHIWIIDRFENFIKEKEHLLSSIYKEHTDPLVLYRGQREAQWVLDSKFARSCKKLLFGENAEKQINPIIKESVEYHQVLFSLLLFKMKIYPPSKELEELALLHRGIDPLFELHRNIQQHPDTDRPPSLMGSPLMDWTTDIDVALYFLNDQRRGDGALYIFNGTATGKTLHNSYDMIIDTMIKATNEGKAFGCPLFIHPGEQTADERVKRQKAVYWVQMDMRYPLEESWAGQERDLNDGFIYKKLILKNGTQQSINDYLMNKGITSSYLFP